MTQIGGRSGRERATIRLKVQAIPPRTPKAMLLSSGLLSASLMLSACAGAATTETTADDTESNASVYGEAQQEELDTAVRHSPAAIQDDDDVQTAAPPKQNSVTVPDSPADPGSTANTAPAAAPDATADTDPATGSATVRGSGSFATVQDACEAVSAHMLSIAFAPLTYSYGGGRAEAKQAVSELPALRQEVPVGLQDDIARIESIFAASGGDYSKIDPTAFKQALDPVEEWVTGTCPDL